MSIRWTTVQKYCEDKFLRLTGVRPFVFEEMVQVIQDFENKKFIAGGRPPKLIIEDQILLMLQYYREYCTLFSVASSYNVSETTAWRMVVKNEKILIKSGQFTLPGKKECLSENHDHFLIDVTESPIERPKKKKSGRVKNIQKDFYSGKKKKHTIKTQVVYCPGTKQIISIAQDTGKVHDFRIFKESETCFLPKTRVSVDSGYQGIVRLHSNSLLPKKRNKKNPLTEEDRRINREISSERVEIENVFGEMKRFRIIAEKYRNRRKRFGIRFTIIASIFNKHQKVKTGL